MFDEETARVIGEAPSLPGLNPEQLADELTAAYVEIASARLKIGEGLDERDQAELHRVADRMSRLADIFETEVVLGVQSERRRSMAFVAASARQVVSQIQRLGTETEGPTLLDQYAIGGEIAASLLFLIAERSSDAYEASREVRASGEENSLRRALILSLGRFARGQFQEIIDISIDNEDLSSVQSGEIATDLLYKEIFKGLTWLARAGLGLDSLEAIETAQAAFDYVKRMAVSESKIDTLGEELSLRATSIFAGPYHLAALLSGAASSFAENILVSVLPPEGAEPEKWTEWIQSEAKRWPFLWENHRKAIETGYLSQGVSLVMTTPTGSGKSTLAALKIVSTLAAGKTVLYLAPTHALVSQIEDDLNKRVVGIAKAVSIENITPEEEVQALPDIAVVTPERCFALLTFAPELFANVGLFVFDEFHLLGVDRPASNGLDAKVDRRGIDAMLCLLTFQAENPGADYLLLSAMVSNGPKIAKWLEELIDRPVIPFEFKWKPTRQLRACVLYDEIDLREQSLKINTPPRAKKAEAVPYGIFSLSSGWNPNASDKLLIRPFSAQPVPLGIGSKKLRHWLTANRYEVAADIAAKFAASGLKVLVFCESIVTCGSVANRLNEDIKEFDSTRNSEQERWREQALNEVGDMDAIYDAGTRMAAVHHGELLFSERRLVETLFKDRDSGVNALAATSTLSQGLNLPCDVVILAASDRLDDADADEKSRIPLMPHEIINALGRAGRAGQAATGISIVVPGSPLPCDIEAKVPSSDVELKVIFAEGDQCLPLSDPLTTLFDQVELEGALNHEASYLLRRLSISLGTEREGVETFESLARRTFGYHQRREKDEGAAEQWLQERKSILVERIVKQQEPPSLPWQEELAAKTGTSTAFIVKLSNAFEDAPLDSQDAAIWTKWLLGQLDPEEVETDAFIRPETVGRVFGRAYSSQPDVVAARRTAIAGINIVLDLWFAARPLRELEDALASYIAANETGVKRPTTADTKAKRARRFAIRLAPDLGFLCGVLSQISQKTSEEKGMEPPPMPSFLSQLVRQGSRTPYHFALAREGEGLTRTEAQAAFEAIESKLEPSSGDTWEEVRKKLDAIRVAELFSAFDVEDITEEVSQKNGGD